MYGKYRVIEVSNQNYSLCLKIILKFCYGYTEYTMATNKVNLTNKTGDCIYDKVTFLTQV